MNQIEVARSSSQAAAMTGTQPASAPPLCAAVCCAACSCVPQPACRAGGVALLWPVACGFCYEILKPACCPSLCPCSAGRCGGAYHCRAAVGHRRRSALAPAGAGPNHPGKPPSAHRMLSTARRCAASSMHGRGLPRRRLIAAQPLSAAYSYPRFLPPEAHLTAISLCLLRGRCGWAVEP